MDSFAFSRYRWLRDEKDYSLFKRKIGGGELMEDIWNFHKNGEQNLFLGVYAQLSQPFNANNILGLVHKAWISTRWDIPAVAAQILHEPREDSPLPTSFLAYVLPSGAADVNAWAAETVLLKEGVKDLDTLRYEVGQGLLPTKDLEPQTLLYVVSFSTTTFGFLFRTSHVPFDGAGIKIVATKFFEHLSKYITDAHYTSAESARLTWGKESGRLLPIITEVLRRHEPAEYDSSGNLTKAELAEEPREGRKYQETLAKVMEGLSEGAPLAHTFKSLKSPPYDPTKADPVTRRAFHTFTVDESKKIVAAGSKFADKLTVNHLAHAALCVVTILDNPPSPGSPNMLFFWGLVDARHRLAKEYRGTFDYPGYCLGMSSIQIPAAIADKYTGEIEKNAKEVVVDFARAVKKDYKHQSELPALLGIAIQQAEQMLTAPPPPPWCGPWFAGDGKGATYLQPKYPKEGNTAIEITDFFLGLNKTDPGPFFRVTEWKGRIMLSADYNALAVEASIVDNWMKKWAELILVAAA
ncbi:hypothetical protein DFH11DRAFT_90645 [Phellopilus nigrolimitatus]|nr:hypothetical protein DFH11DRAFT_90645 [Phellopilus nigrolimitatus]